MNLYEIVKVNGVTEYVHASTRSRAVSKITGLSEKLSFKTGIIKSVKQLKETSV